MEQPHFTKQHFLPQIATTNPTRKASDFWRKLAPNRGARPSTTLLSLHLILHAPRAHPPAPHELSPIILSIALLMGTSNQQSGQAQTEPKQS
jgi:hypothetical protein